MRAPQLIAVCLVLIAGLVLIVPGVRADIQPISAGDHFDKTVTIDSFTDVWSYSWSSNVPLHFQVFNSVSVLIYESTGTSDTGQVTYTSSTGTYTLRWQNDGSSSATLNYDVTNIFGNVQHGLSNLVLIAAIVGVIIIAVIILIVVLVVMGGRKKQVSQPPMAGQVWAPPPVGGRCPTCGNTLVAGAKFCEKCGTRFG